ncbi:hypothetical protein CCYA_CCYA09G2719 [Cyanidiococcus yangmingshanensis]|nr:hypothetical protein CCYA_CCYA09G2719 [Cyanidiococcus yangmingshanensis]
MPLTRKRERGDRSWISFRRWILILLAFVTFSVTFYGKLLRNSSEWWPPRRRSADNQASALATITALLTSHRLAVEEELPKLVLNISRSEPPYLYVTFRDEWDGLVSPSMRANGGLFDAHIHRLFDRLMREPGVLERCQQGSELVIDAGMNFGSFALYAANRGCRVLGFEMQPSVAAAVLLAAHLNGFARQLQVVPHPVWNQSDEVLVFYPRRDNVGGTHAMDASSVGNDSFSAAVHLRTVRIEDWVPRRSLVRFMKLDVEGSELEALRGMLDLLRRKRVLNLVMELQPEASYRRALQLLYSCGYRCIELQLLNKEELEHTELPLARFKQEPPTEAAFWDSFNFHGSDLWCIPWVASARSLSASSRVGV